MDDRTEVTEQTGRERRRAGRGRLGVFTDLLYSILRLIARHIRGFWGALAAFLTVGFLVGLTALLVFAGFAYIVLGGVTQTFDERALRWFELHRSPFLDLVMLEITVLGDGIVLFMIVAVASAFLWLTRHRWSVSLLAIGYVGGWILNKVLKDWFDRPRPSVVEGVDIVHSLSFPSGHAMTSMIAYGAVAYLVARLEPKPAMRRFTWGLAALMILAIGTSRMYLGVHYPSDVLGGYLAGLAWLIFVASGVTAVRFFEPRRPAVTVEEKDLHAEEERAVGVRE